MRKLLPHPLLTPVLAVVWLLLVNSVAPGHIVLGLFLGWAIPFFTLKFWPDPVRITHPGVLMRFLAVVLYDIVVANLAVARLILGPPARLRPAFIEYPLRLRTDLAISLLANTISLTPGTVSAQLSSDRRHLLVHALDVEDVEAAITAIRDRYETPLLKVFEA